MYFSHVDNLRDGVSTTSQGLFTALTLPDANSCTLNGVFTTKSTGVGGMLSDFHLFDSLSERGTVTGTIFTGDSDFLCTLSLYTHRINNGWMI